MQTAGVGRLYSVLTSQPSPVLLLGAGASFRSGIPLAGDMVEQAARWAYAREHGRSPEDPRLLRSDWLPWLRKKSWYSTDKQPADNYPAAIENLLQPRQARKDFFRKLLQPGINISPGYERLAEFLHQNLIKTVLTPNFDSILPDVRVLIRRPHHIEVIQTPSDYTKFSTSPQYPQAVYLHGSVDHYTDQNIIDEVQALDPTLVYMITPLLRDHPLIVVGYRGAEPSVMKHLLLDSAANAHGYRHGIFWCKMRGDKADDLPIFVHDLAREIGTNFTLVDIDGFDELFARDLWQLHQDADLKPIDVNKATSLSAPTLDMAIAPATKGPDDFDWGTARARMLKYSETLQIRIPESPDRAWVADKLVQANLAVKGDGDEIEPTVAGKLLFNIHPQAFMPKANVIVRAIGSAEWLNRAFGESQDCSDGEGSLVVDRLVEGNLWAQYDGINDLLAAFNRPFRLKGEQSETVMPYPPLALKEVVVNALVHRDYSANQSTMIEITAGSIRIVNPGGLVAEVQRRVEAATIEDEIRRGRRGIKGYRNPVLADLFYGSGEMDKAGSGLSDVYKTIRNNGGDVRFGPIDDNNGFEVVIFSRPEAVDEITGTAAPIVLTSSRYAANVLEVISLPEVLYHAGTEASRVQDVWQATPGEWLPPFLLYASRFYSFHDLDDAANPLHRLIDGGDTEALSLNEFLSESDGERRLVQLLNLSFEKHLRRIGLIVDTKRKRGYFPRSDIGPRSITYQARLRKAKRTVVKSRVSPRTGKVSYWEHESLGYRFQRFGRSWGLLLEPAYVFTFDGAKGLLASDRVNRLSTKRASRDYNPAVHNDLSFWSWMISRGNHQFALDLAWDTIDPFQVTDDEDADDRWSDVLALQAERVRLRAEETSSTTPRIIISSRLPTVAVNDLQLPPADMELDAPDEEFEAIEDELEELAEEGRLEAEIALSEADDGD